MRESFQRHAVRGRRDRNSRFHVRDGERQRERQRERRRERKRESMKKTIEYRSFDRRATS